MYICVCACKYIHFYTYIRCCMCFWPKFIVYFLTFLFTLGVPTLSCNLSCYMRMILCTEFNLLWHIFQRQVYIWIQKPYEYVSVYIDQFEFFVIWQDIFEVQNGKFTSGAAREAHTSWIVGAYLGAHLGAHRSLLPWCSRGSMGPLIWPPWCRETPLFL